MKKRICQMAALGSALLLAFSAPVQAAAVTANGTPAAVATNNVQNWPAGPETTSEAAVLIDADTGAVLYDKGMNEYRYPASTTKLMTILLATENSSPKDVVTFTETGIRDVTWDSSNINAQLGEQMTMKDCWFAAYIKLCTDRRICRRYRSKLCRHDESESQRTWLYAYAFCECQRTSG